MKVNIILSEATNGGKFSDIKLSFIANSGVNREVNLMVDFQTINDFSKNTTTSAFDFFLISSMVYGVDNLLKRDEYSIDGWARDIEVSFPVNNPLVWNIARKELEQILSFLTGDYWSISFYQTTRPQFFKEKARRWKSSIPNFHHSDYSFVSLFSGGLDSLVGVINELETLPADKKGLLISHFDSKSPGANIDQERLDKYLRQQPNYRNKFDWIQAGIYLSTHDDSGNKLFKESSFRSRSMLFIGIAVYCIENIPNFSTLLIPENGTMSLNFPLTPSRSSSLSTRTTHPYYLRKLQQLIYSIGLTTKLINPYMMMTKGELVSSCVNQTVLNGIYIQSVSCAKRGRKQNWDVRSGTQHCGVCMPCIYRRAALHKQGLDNQLYGIDIFTTQRDILSLQDMPALFDFLNKRLSSEQIKRNLLVNGSLDMTELDSSASLVERVREEIKQWISDKGNDNLKRLSGLA